MKKNRTSPYPALPVPLSVVPWPCSRCVERSMFGALAVLNAQGSIRPERIAIPVEELLLGAPKIGLSFVDWRLLL